MVCVAVCDEDMVDVGHVHIHVLENSQNAVPNTYNCSTFCLLITDSRIWAVLLIECRMRQDFLLGGLTPLCKYVTTT